ncbi:peritrophin-48 [Drosophila tropicalis]|uniref:peritrophin-48 n=1 Tax=Drosophila tropicalis TaxID=46794 RepID=UPI0035ABA85E
MNFILRLLCIGAALVGAATATSTFDPDLICTLVANGTKMNDPRACNAWVQCIDEKPITGTCTGDLFYDRETETCVDSSSIDCISSEPCAAEANGFAADPYTCNGYYYCINGTGSHGTCAGGMNYNPATMHCIRDFPCEEKMDPDSLCNILPDGVFIKDTNNCNGYQMCWKTKIINGTCPGTFLFNAQKSECVYPQSVECTITESPPITVASGICGKAGDFISDNATCNGYYYCRELETGEFTLEHGVCADGRFFYESGDGGVCAPRSKVNCPYDRCVDLGNSTIQLANESDDDCRGYLICQDGISIGSGTCPADEYFDEMTQRCTTQVISYPACELSSSSSLSSTTTSETATDGSSSSGNSEASSSTTISGSSTDT